ncbi:MAG: Na+/H+ antiporter subunit E [Lachnospiraceae bacterium]|nr:Na+/H+ antiporter subunit E [Lachnospiraceae bacterium]
MYIIFFLIWVIFNGQFTLEIAAFGVVIAGVIYAFICKFMNYSPKTDILIAKKLIYILQYAFILVKEIIKANYAVIKMITSSRYEIEPAVVRFKADLKTNSARVMLANSITLTPGTITVSLEGDEYVVHCLDKGLAEGINSSVFVDLLKKLERME